MKTGDKIYSFKSEFFDLWHYKVADEPINKKDCFSSDEFAQLINEPFEVYEKHIRSIEYEKRVAQLSVETPTKEFPIPLPDRIFEADETVFKTFVGEYDDEMKKEIKRYIEENGYARLRKEEHESHNRDVRYRHFPYSCSIYDIEFTLGFYFSRHGLLRNCFTDEISEKAGLDELISGRLEDFKAVEECLDKDYILYMYGAEGWNKLVKYYHKNFIENFEYGKSILFLNGAG